MEQVVLDKTLIGLIVKNATEMPDEVAMREKRYGVWKPMTWREFQANVQRFALGLLSLGFEEGNNLAIIGPDHLFRCQIFGRAGSGTGG
jgi:long-chain acyl-CoA synthetase